MKTFQRATLPLFDWNVLRELSQEGVSVFSSGAERLKVLCCVFMLHIFAIHQ